MRKTVKTGRGTGKTIETINMMERDKELYVIVPNKQVYKSILKSCKWDNNLALTEEDIKNLLERVVTPKDLREGKVDKRKKFHIEEADQLLQNLLGINFDTMTTSHWHVETFKRNEYEKEGL